MFSWRSYTNLQLRTASDASSHCDTDRQQVSPLSLTSFSLRIYTKNQARIFIDLEFAAWQPSWPRAESQSTISNWRRTFYEILTTKRTKRYISLHFACLLNYTLLSKHYNRILVILVLQTQCALRRELHYFDLLRICWTTRRTPSCIQYLGMQHQNVVYLLHSKSTKLEFRLKELTEN